MLRLFGIQGGWEGEWVTFLESRYHTPTPLPHSFHTTPPFKLTPYIQYALNYFTACVTTLMNPTSAPCLRVCAFHGTNNQIYRLLTCSIDTHAAMPQCLDALTSTKLEPSRRVRQRLIPPSTARAHIISITKCGSRKPEERPFPVWCPYVLFLVGFRIIPFRNIPLFLSLVWWW